MTEKVIRECRICGLEKECEPGRWQCTDCRVAANRQRNHATGRHKPGRQRNFRQHAEIQGVLDGKNSWVTCSKCETMKRYQPKANGKGGRGWKSLVCADCSNALMAEFRAARKAEGARSGVCSNCGAVGEFEDGLQCKACVRARGAAYLRERRAAGKGERVFFQAHSKVCRKCAQRCRVAGFWEGDICPPCVKSRSKRNRLKLRARMIRAGEWQCSACQTIQPVDAKATGWAGQRCPPCHRAQANEYQRQRYEELKKDKGFVESKRKRYREWYHRKKAEEQGDSRSSGG